MFPVFHDWSPLALEVWAWSCPLCHTTLSHGCTFTGVGSKTKSPISTVTVEPGVAVQSTVVASGLVAAVSPELVSPHAATPKVATRTRPATRAGEEVRIDDLYGAARGGG